MTVKKAKTRWATSYEIRLLGNLIMSTIRAVWGLYDSVSRRWMIAPVHNSVRQNHVSVGQGYNDINIYPRLQTTPSVLKSTLPAVLSQLTSNVPPREEAPRALIGASSAISSVSDGVMEGDTVFIAQYGARRQWAEPQV